MRLDASFADVLTQIERERGIPATDLRVAIEVAFLSAYKKKFGIKEHVNISFSSNMSEINITSRKKVVGDDVDASDAEIYHDMAQEIVPTAEIGDEIDVPVEIKNEDFGRLAAQVAKQVIGQKLREAEKRQFFDEYQDKKGQIVTGSVQRLEKNNVIVRFGKHEAVLLPSEQVPGEKFRLGDRVKVYIGESEPSGNNRTPQILLSRTNTGFVQKLFELEVPELTDGTVSIKSISREAGYRTKIAVATIRGNADPVGACIGTKGSRIRAIVDELRGEKIDIVRWSSNPVEFISNALSPAKVSNVKVMNKDRSTAYVIVPDDQLSLAIGREGQNVRLAAKLTNFHIDIESESQAKAKSVGKQA